MILSASNICFAFFLMVLIGIQSALAIHLVSYDCTGTPNICAGSCYFTRFGEVGAVFHFTGLNYDKYSDGTGRNNRRRRAIGCGSRNYCHAFGESCDEFPPASTYQGGLGTLALGHVAPGVGETTCVPAVEQHRQGQKLGRLYLDKPDGWSFHPLTRNDQHIPQCRNEFPILPPVHYRSRVRHGTNDDEENHTTGASEASTQNVGRPRYRLSNNHTVMPLFNGLDLALGQEYNYTDLEQPEQTQLVQVVEIIQPRTSLAQDKEPNAMPAAQK